jgi:FtsP/CotA-like multicopper oxidase with cupredoxin domain
MQSRKLSIGLAVAGVAVAVVLFIVLSGGDESDSDSTTATARNTTTTTGGTTTTTVPKAPRVVFRNGAPVGGVQEIEVDKGDPVRIDVTSDVPAELHVHGYEITKEVAAGKTARLGFGASIEGVFEVELHLHAGADAGSEAQVAELKVTP